MVDMHPVALARIENFIAAVGERFPGLLESVMVTGSAAGHDWQETRSDIDLVLVAWRPIIAADAAALAELHRAASVPTPLDGIYLTVDQLPREPAAIHAAPQVLNGEFTLSMTGGQLSWVTWLELGGAPRVEVSTLGLSEWHDAPPAHPSVTAHAAEFSRDSLATYWSPLGKAARKSSRRTEIAAAAIAWVVLGPPRLVMTAEESRIVSKTEAGIFAKHAFSKHAELIDRVLHWRHTGEGDFSARDAREATALLAACVRRGTTTPKRGAL